MKALLVEDEDLAAKRLIQLLLEIEPEMIITGPLDTIGDTISHLNSHTDYDIIFLDIQLADGKSFSIFDKVKIEIPVIFTTAYDEYAIKAFEHNSIDYLLKPVSKEKLKNSIEKLHKLKSYFGNKSVEQFAEIVKSINSNTQTNYKTRFLVNGGNSLIPFNTNEIAYFSAEDKVVMLTSNQGKKYVIPFTLDYLEQKLNPQDFFRVNRQFIISISSIRKVHNYFNYKLKIELIPEPGTEVIISKLKVQHFKNWMNSE